MASVHDHLSHKKAFSVGKVGLKFLFEGICQLTIMSLVQLGPLWPPHFHPSGNHVPGPSKQQRLTAGHTRLPVPRRAPQVLPPALWAAPPASRPPRRTAPAWTTCWRPHLCASRSTEHACVPPAGSVPCPHHRRGLGAGMERLTWVWYGDNFSPNSPRQG